MVAFKNIEPQPVQMVAKYLKQPFGLLEELSADGYDPSLSEEALGSEDLVEAGGELAASVAYQRLGAFKCMVVRDEQGPGGSGGPCGGWVGCDNGVDHRGCQCSRVLGGSRVLGVAIRPCRCRRGRAAAMAARSVRSSSLIAGRLFCRRSTVFSWRSTMISRSFERRVRTARRAREVRKL